MSIDGRWLSLGAVAGVLGLSVATKNLGSALKTVKDPLAWWTGPDFSEIALDEKGIEGIVWAVADRRPLLLVTDGRGAYASLIARRIPGLLGEPSRRELDETVYTRSELELRRFHEGSLGSAQNGTFFTGKYSPWALSRGGVLLLRNIRYFRQARDFMPRLARWMQEDPAPPFLVMEFIDDGNSNSYDERVQLMKDLDELGLSPGVAFIKPWPSKVWPTTREMYGRVLAHRREFPAKSR